MISRKVSALTTQISTSIFSYTTITYKHAVYICIFIYIYIPIFLSRPVKYVAH